MGGHAREREHLAVKPLLGRASRRVALEEDLERELLAGEARVRRAVDGPHAASTEHGAEDVAAEGLRRTVHGGGPPPRPSPRFAGGGRWVTYTFRGARSPSCGGGRAPR